MIDTVIMCAAVVLPTVLGQGNVLTDEDDEDIVASEYETFTSAKIEPTMFGRLRTEMGKAVNELDMWTVFGYTFMGSVFFMLYAYYTEYVQTGKSISDDVRELMKENAANGNTPMGMFTGKSSTADIGATSEPRRKKVSARSKIAKMSEEEKLKFRGD